MSIKNYRPENIEFVSYTGKYPTLCSGILTLKIDGEEHRFGYGSGMHEPFWTSGGRCGFPNGYDSAPSISEGQWIIDADRIPSELRKFAPEIDVIFNSNVQFGCCGGCI